jgi:hypothetical protein
MSSWCRGGEVVYRVGARSRRQHASTAQLSRSRIGSLDRITSTRRSRRGVGYEAKTRERFIHGTRNCSSCGAGVTAVGGDSVPDDCRSWTGGSNLLCVCQPCCADSLCHRRRRRFFEVVALAIAGVAAALDALLRELQQDFTSPRR